MPTLSAYLDGINWIINNVKGRVGFPGTNEYEGECTAPIVWLFDHVGIPVPSMANDRADGWGTNFPAELAPFFSHEAFQAGRSYPEGTILMWNSPHIAVVISSDGSNTVKVLEQNADPDGAPVQVANRVINNSFHEANFALVPTMTNPAPEPAPAPAPAVPVNEVVPAPTPKPANTTYTRLASPMDLVTNKQPTHKWNLAFASYAEAQAVEDLADGTPITVVGKAERTDLDKPTYFMTEGDFGDADVSGVPTNNVGFNTVDLSTAPAASAPVAPSEPATPTPVVETPASTSDGDKIPVTVTPTDPNKWQTSFTAGLGTVTYEVAVDGVIHDLEGLHPDVACLKGQLVEIAGVFDKDGVEYYRTKTSVQNSTWYGFTKDMLTKGISANGDADIDDLLDLQFGTEIKEDVTKVKKVVVAGGTVNGWFIRLLQLLHIVKQTKGVTNGSK